MLARVEARVLIDTYIAIELHIYIDMGIDKAKNISSTGATLVNHSFIPSCLHACILCFPSVDTPEVTYR